MTASVLSVSELSAPDVPIKIIPRADRKSPLIGRFERLPKWLNCVPLVLQWLGLSLRYRSVSLPSAANPYITCGGMVGEGKREYFDCMGALAKGKTADYLPITVTDTLCVHDAVKQMYRQGLRFPVVAKPDLGWCGYGVRLIQNLQAMENYLRAFPKGETLLLQRYLPEIGEAGLFYARHPNESTGKIIGITLRYFPQVIGDSIHNIAQLIAREPRLRRVKNNKWHHPDFNPEMIPGHNEIVRLATIGSTRIGGLYCDGSEHITLALNKAVDAIAQDMQGFYVGRFDVRYESLEQLQAGEGFTVMEVNGSGSESVQAWDPKYSIRESYRIIFAKQRLLFEIADANRRKGHKPIGLLNLAKLHFHQQKLIERYPLSN